MIKYVIPFLSAFFLTAVLSVVLFTIGKKFKWAKRNSARHINQGKTLRIGGIAMILAFNLTLFLDKNLVIEKPLMGVMLAVGGILALGLWDDFRELSWKKQLSFQFLIATLVFFFGVKISYFSNPFGEGLIHLGIVTSFVLLVLWILIVMNAMNWLDGVDGLSGGVTLIGALTIFFLSLKPDVYQPPMAIISLVLAGVVLGFLVFNFYPAKIIAGTTGSLFMGFLLAVLAIFAGAKIATAILILALPLIDFLWVIGQRLKNKKSIFKADKNHLHHKLIELGWSQKKITLYFYGFTILIAIIALNTRAIGKILTLILSALVITSFLFWINQKTKIKQ